MGFMNKLSIRRKEKEDHTKLGSRRYSGFEPLPRQSNSLVERALPETPRSLSPSSIVPSSIAPSTPRPARTKIIIGLDFGTTFSGAAYSIQHPGDDPKKSGISIVRNWSGKLANDVASSKVPSAIAYENNGNPLWGFDALHSDQLHVFRWLKLLLEPELELDPKLKTSVVIDLQEMKALLKQYKKTAIQVSSNYLKCLWDHVVDEIINDCGPTTFKFARKSIVLTVPASWTDAARHNTFLVAAGAGLVSDDYDLQIISEPEAAAAAILKDRANGVNPGDCYIVLDAGGGTVDLSSYLIKSTDPLCFSECVVSDGYPCGAVFLDSNFKRLLRTTLDGDTFDELPAANVARIMNDFENGIRKIFDGTGNKTYTITLPGVQDNPAKNLTANIMTLSPSYLQPVFDPIMSKIEGLLRKQIANLEKKGHTPKAIFLVGGFGDNHYLKQRLKHRFETRHNDQGGEGGVLVQTPGLGGWESIANGAVQCELLGIQNLISLRIARYNLGISCSSYFDPTIHRLEDKYTCAYTGMEMARNQVRWCLRRGADVKPSKLVRFNFEVLLAPSNLSRKTNTANLILNMVRSEEDYASPRRTSVVRHFVSISLQWSRSELEAMPTLRNRSGQPYWNPSFNIVMAKGPAKLEFWCEINGLKRGEITDVKYNEPLKSVPSVNGIAEVPLPEGKAELE